MHSEPRFISTSTMDGGTFGPLCPDAGVRYTNSVCVVCTARSSGVHYGVVACEGCKAFYRRALQNKTSYRCFLGGNCAVGPQAKGRCRPCRFAKCVKVGMKLDGKVMGRTPLWKRNVHRAVSELVPDASSSPPTSPEIPPKSIVIPSVIDEPTVTDSSYSPERGPSIRVSLVDGVLDEASKLRSCTPLSKPSPYGVTDISLNSVAPNKYSKVYFDESFGELDKEEMNWQSYSAMYSDDLSLQDVMQSTTNVHDTISAVYSAIQSIYGTDFSMWDADMHDMMVNGNIPYQPQISLAAYKENSSVALVESVRKHCSFSMLLPGFSTFDEGSQQVLLKDKWPEEWLVTRRSLVRGNNFYYVNGPLRVHTSVYWLQQTHQSDAITALLELSNAMNKLELTHLEAFFLYAVSMFAPVLIVKMQKFSDVVSELS